MQTKLIKLDEFPDYVEVAGQRVTRPNHVSVKEWIEFWERIKASDWGAY